MTALVTTLNAEVDAIIAAFTPEQSAERVSTGKYKQFSRREFPTALAGCRLFGSATEYVAPSGPGIEAIFDLTDAAGGVWVHHQNFVQPSENYRQEGFFDAQGRRLWMEVQS